MKGLGSTLHSHMSCTIPLLFSVTVFGSCNRNTYSCSASSSSVCSTKSPARTETVPNRRKSGHGKLAQGPKNVYRLLTDSALMIWFTIIDYCYLQSVHNENDEDLHSIMSRII